MRRYGSCYGHPCHPEFERKKYTYSTVPFLCHTLRPFKEMCCNFLPLHNTVCLMFFMLICHVPLHSFEHVHLLRCWTCGYQLRRRGAFIHLNIVSGPPTIVGTLATDPLQCTFEGIFLVLVKYRKIPGFISNFSYKHNPVTYYSLVSPQNFSTSCQLWPQFPDNSLLLGMCWYILKWKDLSGLCAFTTIALYKKERYTRRETSCAVPVVCRLHTYSSGMCTCEPSLSFCGFVWKSDLWMEKWQL